MFVGQALCCFHLHDQQLVDDHVGLEGADWRSVLVEYRQWYLGFHVQTQLPQSVPQGILVYFLQMTWTVITVDRITGGANDVR